METVGKLRAYLEGVPDDTPVVSSDTRSGVIDEVTFGMSQFDEGDDDYGVDLPIGTKVFVMYIGI